ncbi:hypothetical protein GCM10010251_83450 [Streptomyces aurantiogriseus]|uniref:Uncharacterized protein n=1 Tax=Streptomyces aurantiogriseus TaxID=66870 RepID=A0A918FLY5_9ACTN|nr:hypothetical protein GCM10010251_83450 [Streptomyces aurantiogriseus]
MRESRRPHLSIPNAVLRFSAITRSTWVEILSMGEEEVEVTESEVPVLTGTWCKREMLRR